MAGLLPLGQQELQSDSLELRGRPFVRNVPGIQSHFLPRWAGYCTRANYKV
jgi:hypothetical protein